MHRVHAGFTLLAPLRVERVEAATKLLRALHTDQARLPFASTSTTHFATITIIPAQAYNDDLLPATLLFATSFCGPLRDHVVELVAVMGDALRELLAHCERFDPRCSDEDLETYLVNHRHGDTFYSGMHHLSPDDVRKHQELRAAIEDFVDEQQAQGTLATSAVGVQRQIQEHVLSRPDLAWAREPWTPSYAARLALHWRSLIVEGIVLLLLLLTAVRWFFVDSALLGGIVIAGWIAVALFLIFVAVLVFSLREAEQEQTYLAQRPPDERARELAATQNRPVINEFTLGGPIKEEGVLRPIFLALSLWVIARVAEGVPGLPYIGTGINIPTVATARWIVADGGKRLLFISNYTNAGEPYVRDFIETRGGAMRINLSFGFGRGYPKTRWILWDGALVAPNTYLHALAENTLPTLFWYGPYRDIGIDNIKVARKIREGLFADYNEQDAQKWLHLL